MCKRVTPLQGTESIAIVVESIIHPLITMQHAQPAHSDVLMPSVMPACAATKMQNSTGEGTKGAYYAHTHHCIRMTVGRSVGVADRGGLHVKKCSRLSGNTRTLNHAFSGSCVPLRLMQAHFYLWSWCAGRQVAAAFLSTLFSSWSTLWSCYWLCCKSFLRSSK